MHIPAEYKHARVSLRAKSLLLDAKIREKRKSKVNENAAARHK